MAITALQFFSTDYKPHTIDYTQFEEYVEDIDKMIEPILPMTDAIITPVMPMTLD